MKISERLARLEGATRQAPPMFLPVGDSIANSLDYFGVLGGMRFDRQPDETSGDFKQRCIDYDAKHRHRKQMPIFMDVNL